MVLYSPTDAKEVAGDYSPADMIHKHQVAGEYSSVSGVMHMAGEYSSV